MSVDFEDPVETKSKPVSKEDTKSLEAIKLAIAALEKQFGPNTVIHGSAEFPEIEVIPTGNFELDLALGVGGLPKGKITEISGPESLGKTLIALNCAANAQKSGGRVAYIDVECDLNPDWATTLGVNVDDLYISQPSSGEEALTIMERLVKTNAFDLIVLDSVAAMATQAELEGEMEDAQVAALPRLMAKGMHKLRSPIAESNTCAIFINQVRDKIGFMACLHKDTVIPLVDGTSKTIGEIVDNKLNVEVYAIDESTGEIKPARVIDWHSNPNKEKTPFLTIRFSLPETKNGVGSTTLTVDHKLLTRNGWKRADNLSLEDKLLTKYNSIINSSLEEFLAGTACCDLSFSQTSGNRKNAGIRIQDNQNLEYARWKVEKLSKAFRFTEHKLSNEKTIFDSNQTFELGLWKQKYNGRNPLPTLENITPLKLALMIMDDATLTRTFNKEGKQNRYGQYVMPYQRYSKDRLMMARISELWASAGFENSLSKTSIRFTVEATKKIASIIASYVPDSMQHKLPTEYKGLYKEFELDFNPEIRTLETDIISIEQASARKNRNMTKYDITVENHHNYLAGNMNNGVIVHNSGTTTPGGRALKHACAVRIELSRAMGSNVRDKKTGESLATRVKAEIIKNKVGNPMKVVEYENIHGVGFDNAGTLLKLGQRFGLIERAGAWYSYGETKLGNGEENAKIFINDNPDLEHELRESIAHLYKEKAKK